MIEELLAEAALAGAVLDDTAPGELASFCLHALTAAGDLPSGPAVHRLVTVTLTGLQPSAVGAPEDPRHTDATAHPPRHHGPHSAHGPDPNRS